jgi:hypothetical protein
VLDRANSHRAKDGRKGPAHDVPVRQHVGNAGGNAQIVLEDNEGAVLAAHEIGPADIDVGIVRNLEPAHLAAKMLRAED